MSDTPNDQDRNAISRREALRTTAKVAGAAAFATPVVMGVFSSRVSAIPAGCDPSVDSDAIDLLQGQPRKWNINCSDNEKYGRYNAQRTEALLPGGAGTAAINFGFTGTDNFPVECSFYVFDVPAGWDCSASFVVGDANDTDGCPDGGIEFDSVPGDCEIWPEGGSTPEDFVPPPGALPVPYCQTPSENPSGGFCEGKTFLWLVEWTCCPPA
jgi:hypothetical protein